ncbi:MAG: hypothetical protein PHF36_09575 [Candidatus Cloacimonetes bacterium]|nr:hypothetical protein [Acholeplasmataceae bacterium]MDD2651365.1 hypothetical protein [Candidatus Cloacimonadota bacterium]
MQLYNDYTRIIGHSGLNVNCCCSCGKEHRYVMTFHEYVLSQYAFRVDRYRINHNLKENAHQFVINGKIDEELFTDFIANNMELLSDEKLFHNILLEARNKYNLEIGDPLYSPFDAEARQIFLDYKGQYDGFNIIPLEREKALNNLYNWVKNNKYSEYSQFNQYEKDHFEIIYSMVAKGEPLAHCIAFIISSINDSKFSTRYRGILEFAINNGYFHESGDTGLYDQLGLPWIADVVIRFNGTWSPWKWSVEATGIIVEVYKWIKSLF